MTVLEIVALKVKHLDSTEITPDVIQLAVDEVAQKICNYCNIFTVPTELVYTHANMASELLSYEYAIQNPEATSTDNLEFASGDIESITEGDVSVKLKGGNNLTARTQALKSHSANLDAIVFNHQDDLNRFRRMVW